MQFVQPQSARDAARALADGGATAHVLAGGTDLLVKMKSGMIEPGTVVDIKHVPGIRDITPEDGGFRIGAAVPGQELGEHAGVKALWPGVVEACELIGSTQIQGRCTMVGNLCNGGPAADSVPAMIAAGAVARVEGPEGSRDMAVEDIPAGPGQINLEPGEFISSVHLPARPAGASDAYLRFIPRTEMDIAVVSAGVSLQMGADGTCAAARVAIGAVGPRVVLVPDAGAALVGTTLDDAAIGAMMTAVRAAASPIDDKRGTVEYRIEVVGVLAKRAALIARQRAGDRT